MDIPARLKKFPLWANRYPVHFTVTRNKDGSPQWKNLDRKKQILCTIQGRCHLCGEKLIPPYWFVCGPFEWEERIVSSNGPMHEECAKFAIFICPFLNNPEYQSKTDVSIGRSLSVILSMKEHGIEGKNVRPNKIALCTAVSYKCDTTKQILDFEVPNWVHTDWNTAPQRVC